MAKFYLLKRGFTDVADANTTLLNLNESVSMLQELGFFNYVLPLGIFFVILYGILDQYKIISKDKRVNALASILISSFILLYAYVNNLEWFFSLFYTKMSVAIIVLLFAVTLAVFVFKALEQNAVIPKGKEKVWSSIIIIMSVLIINGAFINAPAPLGEWASEVSGIVVAFGIIGGILSWFISGKGGEE